MSAADGSGARRPGGRPSSLTPGTAAKILAAVEAGAPFATACEAAGVHRSTGYRWRKMGKPDNAPEEFREFCDALMRARATFEAGLVRTIHKAQDWRAAAWLLARRFPDRWGRGPRAAEPAAPSPLTREALAAFSDEQLEKLAGRLARGGT